FRRTLLLVAAVAAAGAWRGWTAPLVVLALGLPWAWLHALLYTRWTAYALTPHAVAFRRGWWKRRLGIVRYSKIQALALRRSPLDRLTGMASLHVDTAGAGRVGHAVEIHFLDAAAAAAVRDRLFDEASRRTFRW
ncbi:MAG TPA: PH domain-containing protein, partial [Candidatus Polarisedimenticolaceae bacterium]|nr:PH domain-containing protein [Candidatus Polarisedimenticolaceae bacterium]